MVLAEKAKVGSVRLFLPQDAGSGIHGWKPVGFDGLVNPKGWAALHIVVQKYIDGQISPKDLYDQIVIIENPGAVVVCTSGDKVGLVEIYRFTAERLCTDPGYVKKLADEGRWDEVLATLGTYQWELPRGLAPDQGAGTTDYPTKNILAAAKLEAAEEGGFEIINPRVVGRVNPNTTFFAHAQFVVAAEFVDKKESRPEELEMIGKARLFSKQEVQAMITGGELTDALSLAALRIVGF